MSIDLYDTHPYQPDDEVLQRRAAHYVVDHLPPFEAMEIIEMLMAPLRDLCGRCGRGTTGEHDYDCLDGVR